MKKFCVYLTTYYGNKLPPFYIGSSSVYRINRGYGGSVSSKRYKDIWKTERKNNPHMFKTRIVSYCDTREDAFVKENYFHEKLDVVNNSLYINAWYARIEKNFKPLNGKLNPMYGKHHQQKTKDKISQINTGRKASEKTKNKMKESQSKRSTNNTWIQLSPEIHEQFKTYENFEKYILDILPEYCYCPTLVANILSNISYDVVIKICKRNNISYNINSSFTKIVKNYGNKWKTYDEYVNDIINLYNNLHCTEQIAKILNVNSFGVSKVLKEKGLTPHKLHDNIIAQYSEQAIYMNNMGINKTNICKDLNITLVVLNKILSKVH